MPAPRYEPTRRTGTAGRALPPQRRALAPHGRALAPERRPLPPEGRALPPERRGTRSRRASRRPAVVVTLALVVLAGVAFGIADASGILGPSISPLRARIVSIADSQLGYRTDPASSYCNKYSAYWDSGTTGCGPGLRSEEWCADFAAWVWQQAGAEVTYSDQPGDLNSASASFYLWGTGHGTWHAVGSGYTPRPGDVAVYGLDTATMVAAHVAVVTGYSAGEKGPDVVNGDGDRTGFSVVETGADQYQADTQGGGEPLSGYVSPTAAQTGGVRSTG